MHCFLSFLIKTGFLKKEKIYFFYLSNAWYVKLQLVTHGYVKRQLTTHDRYVRLQFVTLFVRLQLMTHGT